MNWEKGFKKRFL